MATKRKLSGGILENIVKYTEETEIPAIFAMWSGIAAVAMCLGRNCFIDQGYFTIYPNLYIVLVAGSARCKKSSAITLVSDFIYKVNESRSSAAPVRLLSQKMTTQALIGSLAGAGEGSVTILQPAVGAAIVDELYTLINRESFKDGMIPVLTKLYDCQDFPYETRGRGIENVRNPCLCILGGSTSEWIREAVPMAAVGGGFTSRVVFVFKDKGEKLVPWPSLSDENRERRREIVNDLCSVTEMRGPFGVAADAKRRFEELYVEFHTRSSLLDEPNLHGYCGRRGHTLLKTAMAISASRSDERVITLWDMETANKALSRVEESMPTVLRSISSKEVGDVFEQIIGYIQRHRVVNRSELISQVRNKMTADELSIMIRSLEQEGLVKVEVDGPKVRYVYVGK